MSEIPLTHRGFHVLAPTRDGVPYLPEPVKGKGGLEYLDIVYSIGPREDTDSLQAQIDDCNARHASLQKAN